MWTNFAEIGPFAGGSCSDMAHGVREATVSGRVLLIEDDDDYVEIFSRLMRGAGYVVESASTAAEGIAKAADHREIHQDVVLHRPP